MTIIPSASFTTSSILTHPTIAHGFFGTEGGVSEGIFASLNCGLGSTDTPENVKENRGRVACALGGEPKNLTALFQIHSSTVLTITEPFTDDNRPEADGMVTNVKGIILSILTADCAPLLFADTTAGVIGACHAGWKGALNGIAQNTINAMLALGAKIENITCAIGPSIKQASYEVGIDYALPFTQQDEANIQFFKPAGENHYLFDLPGYLIHRLTPLGIKIDHIDEDTYSAPDQPMSKYFSYRRKTHKNEPDYGRQLSSIVLK